MEGYVKESPLIISMLRNKTKGIDFILKKDTKLSEVLYNLPSGIIDKRETGIGATTLEIRGERNSIIVLPTRYTAKSKSYSEPNSYYFGTFDGKKISLDRKETLNNYLNNEKIVFKKIIVVADSLPTLIEHIGLSVYKDFFLLIDEIDTIQKDSSYRKKMEVCIEYYKKFPIDKRAVVSATLLSFSDPELADVIQTSIKYEKYNKGAINLISSNNPLPVGSEILIETLISSPDKKIVFAFNEITPLEGIAESLIRDGIVDFNEISFLCGQNPKNKDRVEKYNSTGIQKYHLPSRINFITSAYFTGFDIYEPYHLILVSELSKQHTIISELDAVQIIGRCRKPHNLESINFIYSLNTKNIPIRKKDELVQSAKKEIEGLNCIFNKYKSNLLLKEKALELRASLIKASGFSGFNFVKENSEGDNDISYLNIDAFLENQRTKTKVFKNKSYLKRYFESEGYSTYSTKRELSQIIENQDINKLKHENSETIAFLKTNPNEISIKEFRLKKNGLSIAMCDFYTKAMHILGKRDTIKRLAICDTKKKVSDLDNYFKAFVSSDSDFVKRNILLDFPIGKVFNSTNEYEKQVEESALAISSINFERFSLSKAKKFVKTFVEIKNSTSRINSTHVKVKKVISHNPLKFRKCKPKSILIN
jgi:hypothetical protein